MTDVQTSQYWISPTAVYLGLNAMGNYDYVQANAASGASIICYIPGIKELGYDAGHNYKRWQLVVAPTCFEEASEKYVYVAIPRDENNTLAPVVFPSEHLDVYGKNEAGEQIGSNAYYYIWLRGIISSSLDADQNPQPRSWTQPMIYGTLSTDEALDAGGLDAWWTYSSVDDTVSFDKNISAATFLSAQIHSLILGNGKLNDVAIYGATAEDATDKVVTPDFLRKYAQSCFLSKLHDDTAQGRIDFSKGLTLGGGKGELDAEGNARLLSAVVSAMLSSARYVSGVEGWRLWIDEGGLANLELDTLTVRHVMHVLELVVDRIRSAGGKIVVSAANGKVKTVKEEGDDYRLTFETECSFRAHDLMRCQVFTGEAVREYWVEVKAADATGATVAKSEFAQWATEPREGDEVVLMGNTADTKRQNLISISAADDGEPRIDVMDGVSRKSLAGALCARLGSLDGITDDWFPVDGQPKGNGLYANNVYLRGTFLLNTGEDVKTRLEAVEGKIESAVEGVRQDLMEDRGYLNNPTFGSGMSHWTAQSAATFFVLGSRWVWANGSVLSKRGDGACVTTDEGRTVVRIRNSHIMQKSADMRVKPEIKTNSEGMKEPVPVYLSFACKVIRGGELKVEFANVDNEGFVEYKPLAYSGELTAADSYRQITVQGLWNGTGDFKLSFTGEMLVHMLILSTDRTESLAYTYRTLFEQSERLVKMSAAVFDKDEKALSETGLMIQPEGSGIYIKDAAGKLSLIGIAVEETDADGNARTVIKLTADNIKLEGLVTANGNFKILEDGSVEAVNGKFTGEINADKGSVGGFTIAAGRIGTEATKAGGGGGLAIYDDFIRVGTEKGYVMLGDDVIPTEVGGAFSAAGRVVNKRANTGGEYGVDQVNYGLLLNVSGGTKNYGVTSDAALMAPSFVNTRAQLLTFDVDAGSYEIDFSQANVILMYFKKEGSSGLEVTLPDEDSVARQFGVKELPEEFATAVTFRVRPGSQPITLKDIYDHGEHLRNYVLSAGNSATVLISKADGFRYQILNHTY